MKNQLLFALKSKVTINVKGRNISRFIRRLINNNIELINIDYIDNDEVNIKIFKKDLDTIEQIKSIYEINIINYNGMIKLVSDVKFNKYIIFFIIIGLAVIVFLSKLIFSIEIVSNDNEMKENILEELNNNGISKYKFKKNYYELQSIKEKILKKYKNNIEWIEIENIGTKYIIKYEPRIIKEKEEITKYRHIVAKKDAIIYDVDASSGQIVRMKNDYVKKGDIIVSGYIDLLGNIKQTVSSIGKVYGEVWYTVTVSYPFKYNEKKETGNKKYVYTIKLLNKTYEIFNFNKYKNKIVEDKTILKNNLLPFKITKEYQKEIKIIKENNTEEAAIKKAIELGKKKINKKLKKNEFIIDYKIINKSKNKDYVTLNLFFTVCEDITDYQYIEEYKEEIKDENNN